MKRTTKLFPPLLLCVLLAAALLAACSAEPSATTTPAPTTPTASPTPTATPRPPTSTPVFLEASLVAELKQLESEVEALRGLDPANPVTRHAVTAEGMREVLIADLDRRYSSEQAEDQARVLAALGLIEPGFDLRGFYIDLISERGAQSFYDRDGEVLFVLTGEADTASSRISYVHQYALAVLDSEFDLDRSLNLSPSSCLGDGDRCLAVRSLAEGDASLVEEQWLRIYASEEDIDGLIGLYTAFESPAFSRAPDYLQSLSLFPFREGTEFARWHHRRAGWAGVDSLYASPPSSSEAVLHPERPTSDAPVLLDLGELTADDLGSRWDELSRTTLGEFAFRQLLAAWLPSDRAQEAAAGWGGDRLVAFGAEGQISLVVVQSWDTIRDAQEAFLAWRELGDLRFGQHSSTNGSYEWQADSAEVRLERGSNQTMWLMAPDASTLEALQESLVFPAPKAR